MNKDIKEFKEALDSSAAGITANMYDAYYMGEVLAWAHSHGDTIVLEHVKIPEEVKSVTKKDKNYFSMTTVDGRVVSVRTVSS